MLLEKNPLETVANLRTIKAVMIRGIWLPEPEKLPFTGADIEIEKMLPNSDELAAMVALAEAHDVAGYAQSSVTSLAVKISCSRYSWPQSCFAKHSFSFASFSCP